MAERTGDNVGVEECKSFTPPNVPTTSASTTRLPLGSLDFNTRIPDTGTATPSKGRVTQSQRLANWLKKAGLFTVHFFGSVQMVMVSKNHGYKWFAVMVFTLSRLEHGWFRKNSVCYGPVYGS